MYADTQPFSLLLKAGEAKNACADAISPLYRYKKDHIINVIAIIAESADHRIPFWIFRHLKEDISAAARQLLFRRIATVPVLALRLYSSESRLTNYEETALYRIIKTELPTAYREIEEGLLTRRKKTGL